MLRQVSRQGGQDQSAGCRGEVSRQRTLAGGKQEGLKILTTFNRNNHGFFSHKMLFARAPTVPVQPVDSISEREILQVLAH